MIGFNLAYLDHDIVDQWPLAKSAPMAIGLINQKAEKVQDPDREAAFTIIYH